MYQAPRLHRRDFGEGDPIVLLHPGPGLDGSVFLPGVMRLADRAVVGLMTPRTDVDWIDITAPETEIRQRLISTPHSRLPEH